MRNLLTIPLLLLCSCLATQGALTKLNLQIESASQAAIHAKNRAEDVNATQASIDEAMAKLAEEGKATASALVDVKDAMLEDAENIKGISGFGMGMDGGILSLVTGAAYWLLRDRRKRLGQDPLQRSDVPTPPTTV